MRKAIGLILTLLAGLYLQAQVVVSIGSVENADPGTILTIPVSVSGMDAANGGTPVSAIELHLNFSGNVFEYDTTLSFHSLLPESQWFYGVAGNEYSTNWIEPNLNTLSIPDESVLFEISFMYNGGNGDFEFIASKCEILDATYSIIQGIVFENGSVTPSSGSDISRWNGTGLWITAQNWNNGIPGAGTIAMIESGSVTLESNVVCKALDIASNCEFTVGSLASLTIDSTLNNNGVFSLLSDASGTSSVIIGGDISGSGQFNTQKYLDLQNGRRYLVSPPVESAVVNSLSGSLMETYMENTASWTTLGGNDVVSDGNGYRCSGTGANTLQFNGMIRSGDYTVDNLSFANSAGRYQKELKLTGNPFTSAIYYDPALWTINGLDRSVYVWDEYKYLAWNGKLGSLTDGVIPAMQGFFVRANTAGASLTIPSDSKLHSSIPYYKSSEPVQNLMVVKLDNVNDENHFDEMFLHIDASSTTGYDATADAYKLLPDNNFPQVFSKTSDNSELSINTQPAFQSVQLVCKVNQPGSYRLKFNNLSSFTLDQPLAFEDKKTNTLINLRSSDNYVFISDGTTETGRFYIHFIFVGMDDDINKYFRIGYSEQALTVYSSENALRPDKIAIYNMAGQLLESFQNPEIGIPNYLPLNPGVYIVKMISGNLYSSQKLLVR